MRKNRIALFTTSFILAVLGTISAPAVHAQAPITCTFSSGSTPPPVPPPIPIPPKAAVVTIELNNGLSNLAAHLDNAMVLAQFQQTKTTNGRTIIIIIIIIGKIDSSQPARVGFDITDTLGNFRSCDPILTDVVRAAGTLATETFPNISRAESLVMVYNGSPGLGDLEVRVNGRRFKLSALRDGEKRALDVSSAMLPGDHNVLNLTAKGRPGGSASVMVAEGDSQP